MKKLIVPLLLVGLPLVAQETGQIKEEKVGKPKEEKKEEQKKEEPKKEEPKAESPSPAVEKALSGVLDLGYRVIPNNRGDYATYRSVVNEGEGIRLPNLELNFTPEKSKYLDELRLNAHNWGDPYDTVRLTAGKRGWWEFTGRYSNMFYYNNLPSFANLNTVGVYQGGQRAYDTSVRDYDNEFSLFPGRILSPYIGFLRNSSAGNGVTPLVLDGNEYPLRNLIGWDQETVYGGVRFELRRFHATVEQGENWFNDNQKVYSTEQNLGDRLAAILGQTQLLTSGTEQYTLRGSGPYTKVMATAEPVNFLDLSGQYVRSNPNLTSQYNQAVTGNLYEPALFALFPGETDQLFGSVHAPHTLAGGSAELRVWKFRIRQNYDKDQYESPANASLTDVLTATPQNLTTTLNSVEYLKVTTERESTEVLFEADKHITVRGGYRREWGQAQVPGDFLTTGTTETASLLRNVGLFGLVVRPIQRLTWTSEYEVGRSPETIFRTSLGDYSRWRNQVRYQVRDDLSLQGVYAFMVNTNRQSAMTFDARQASLSAQWVPRSAKHLSLLADYTRSTLRSDITYLIPLALISADSLYADNAHTGTLLAEVTPSGAHAPRFTAGGSFVATSGSRPSRYWQPLGRVAIPLNNRWQVYSEWRWYGFRQPFDSVEGFRTHEILSGFRLLL